MKRVPPRWCRIVAALSWANRARGTLSSALIAGLLLVHVGCSTREGAVPALVACLPATLPACLPPCLPAAPSLRGHTKWQRLTLLASLWAVLSPSALASHLYFFSCRGEGRAGDRVTGSSGGRVPRGQGDEGRRDSIDVPYASVCCVSSCW